MANNGTKRAAPIGFPTAFSLTGKTSDMAVKTRLAPRMVRNAPSSMGEVTIRDAALLLRSHSKSAQHGTLVHALMEGVEWLEAHERTAEDLRVSLNAHGASDADAEAARAIIGAYRLMGR